MIWPRAAAHFVHNSQQLGSMSDLFYIFVLALDTASAGTIVNVNCDGIVSGPALVSYNGADSFALVVDGLTVFAQVSVGAGSTLSINCARQVLQR